MPALLRQEELDGTALRLAAIAMNDTVISTLLVILFLEITNEI